MSIKLSSPLEIKNDLTGDIFKVVRIFNLDIDKKEMLITWQIVDSNKKIIRAGNVLLKDTPAVSNKPASTEFTDFYNTWTTHEQLVQVAFNKAKTLDSLLKEKTGTYESDLGLF